jgi:hypothetical protein
MMAIVLALLLALVLPVFLITFFPVMAVLMGFWQIMKKFISKAVLLG